jgi:hypothetical protein
MEVKPNCLLGLSGSVASIKAEELVSALQAHFTVVVITTRSALHFIDLPALRKNVPSTQMKMNGKAGRKKAILSNTSICGTGPPFLSSHLSLPTLLPSLPMDCVITS